MIRISPKLTATLVAFTAFGSTALGAGGIPSASAHTATRPAARTISGKGV